MTRMIAAELKWTSSRLRTALGLTWRDLAARTATSELLNAMDALRPKLCTQEELLGPWLKDEVADGPGAESWAYAIVSSFIERDKTWYLDPVRPAEQEELRELVLNAVALISEELAPYRS